MPTEYSNFTTPDWQNSDNGVQGNATRGTGDNGEVWNPTGGPDGRGAWEQPKQRERYYQFTQGAWGGRGNDIDGNGEEVAGTSGAARDATRYRGMGAAPLYQDGPQIDRSQINESRGISMGSLGLLGQTAAGTSPSAAERLGTQMGERAQAAQYSLAGSVRGGAMARAAASRNAAMNAGVIDAQTRQANAATRAGEMAGARGAYFDAATGQRRQDLGAATSQAGFDAGQRAANDQREGFYEDLGQQTKNAQLGHELGRTESEQNAANASAAQSQAERQADARQTAKIVSTVAGGAAGAAQGWAKSADSAPPQKSSDPWDPTNYSGSDERMKTQVVPLYEDAGSGVQRHWDRDVSVSSPETPAGASLSGPAPRYGVSPKSESTPKAKASASKPRKLSDAELKRLAEDMLETQANSAAAQLAAGPSARGYQESPRWLDDYMTSDEKTKKDAKPVSDADKAKDEEEARKFMEGSGYTFKKPQTYEEMSKAIDERNAQDKEIAARAKREKQAPAVAYAVGQDDSNQALADRLKPIPIIGKWVQGKVDARKAETDDQKAERGVAWKKDENASLANKKGWNDWASSKLPESVRKWAVKAPVSIGYRPELDARQQTTSDERAKKDVYREGPMAEANRSMAPFEYAYKPGFDAEAGQRPGEKNVGPMAQNMASDPVASTAIVERPDGMLAIDKDKGLKLVMGGLSALQSEVDAMKRKERRA